MDSSEKDVYRSGIYNQIMDTGFIGFYWKLIHRNIERDFKNNYFPRILELGAGTGQHYRFVKSSHDEYFETDLRVELLLDAAVNKDVRVKKAFQDIQNITFENNSFDRVIITCVLPHVTDPLKSLEEIKRVSKHGCWVSIYIPTEPGMILRLFRYFTTYRKNLRNGVEDPYLSHFKEHQHYFIALNHFIYSVFKESEIKRRYYPFKLPGWNLNLYAIYQIFVIKN